MHQTSIDNLMVKSDIKHQVELSILNNNLMNKVKLKGALNATSKKNVRLIGVYRSLIEKSAWTSSVSNYLVRDSTLCADQTCLQTSSHTSITSFTFRGVK